MKRNEFEEYLQRMQDEHSRQLEGLQKALKNVGLEVEQGVVRYADSPPNTSIAPTWEARRLAQIRTYELRTRLADISAAAKDGIQAIIAVHNAISASEPMHPALENDLREIQEETKKATKFLIGKHAGYADNRYYQ